MGRLRNAARNLLIIPALVTACGDPGKANDTGVGDTDAEVRTWYADGDGDGYGDPLVTNEGIEPPSLYVDNGEDCDDGDAEVNPAATEVCNGIDDDCDGEVDGEGATDRLSCYQDLDGDGFGDPGVGLLECACPSRWVDNDGDCDDSCEACWTDAEEICEDGHDNDCDGWDAWCTLEGAMSFADADAKLLGEGVEDLLGDGVLLAEDITGDGYPDLILSTWSQRVSIVSGPVEGSQVAAEAAAATITGDLSIDESISHPNVVGDLDGDGNADIAYYSTFAEAPLRILLGPVLGEFSTSDHDIEIAPGTHEGGWLRPVFPLPVGDVDGDNTVDLLVGAPNFEAGEEEGRDGAVLLFAGPITSDIAADDADVLFVSGRSGQGLGTAGSAGDLDGDGLVDLVLGADAPQGGSWPSSAFVVYGPYSGQYELGGGNGVQDALLEGYGWDGVGADVEASGDLDGDGLADIVLSGPYYGGSGTKHDNNTGAVYILYGAVTGKLELFEEADAMITGTTPEEHFGYEVEAGGDLDGDGTEDLVVTAMGEELSPAYAGFVHIFYDALSGTHDTSSADALLVGEAYGDGAMWLSTKADVDLDGFADILVGAPGDDTNGEQAGAAYLLFGGGG